MTEWLRRKPVPALVRHAGGSNGPWFEFTFNAKYNHEHLKGNFVFTLHRGGVGLEVGRDNVRACLIDKPDGRTEPEIETHRFFDNHTISGRKRIALRITLHLKNPVKQERHTRTHDSLAINAVVSATELHILVDSFAINASKLAGLEEAIEHLPPWGDDIPNRESEVGPADAQNGPGTKKRAPLSPSSPPKPKRTALSRSTDSPPCSQLCMDRGSSTEPNTPRGSPPPPYRAPGVSGDKTDPDEVQIKPDPDEVQIKPDPDEVQIKPDPDEVQIKLEPAIEAASLSSGKVGTTAWESQDSDVSIPPVRQGIGELRRKLAWLNEKVDRAGRNYVRMTRDGDDTYFELKERLNELSEDIGFTKADMQEMRSDMLGFKENLEEWVEEAEGRVSERGEAAVRDLESTAEEVQGDLDIGRLHEEIAGLRREMLTLRARMKDCTGTSPGHATVRMSSPNRSLPADEEVKKYMIFCRTRVPGVFEFERAENLALKHQYQLSYFETPSFRKLLKENKISLGVRLDICHPENITKFREWTASSHTQRPLKSYRVEYCHYHCDLVRNPDWKRGFKELLKQMSVRELEVRHILHSQEVVHASLQKSCKSHQIADGCLLAWCDQYRVVKFLKTLPKVEDFD